MLYALVSFSDQIGPLNVFRYITFRTGGAIMTALLFVFLFGPAIIDLLRVKQGKGQPIREDGPATHFAKKGTPTMGGLMILSGVTVSTLLWANWANWYVWIVLFVTLCYGVIGFYDDYLKVTNSNDRRRFRQAAAAGRDRRRRHCRLGGHARRQRGLLLVADRAVLQERGHSARRPVRAARHFRDRRRRQCRQPHRRPRRARHRAGDDRGRHLRAHRLPDGQRQLRALPADPLRAGRGRAGHHLRRADRRGARLPVVQRARPP